MFGASFSFGLRTTPFLFCHTLFMRLWKSLLTHLIYSYTPYMRFGHLAHELMLLLSHGLSSPPLFKLELQRQTDALVRLIGGTFEGWPGVYNTLDQNLLFSSAPP